MSFSATGVRRPLQTKPKQNPFLKRASSSFGNHVRRKPGSSESLNKRQLGESDSDDGLGTERLHHGPIVTTLACPGNAHNVLSLIRHAKDHIFASVPERAAGMNSVRIAEVLNFRKSLAPIVSIAHLHALSDSPTATDREIAALVQKGIVRRISVIGRGRGGAPLGDGIVLTADWQALVRQSGLDAELKDKYLLALGSRTVSPAISAGEFSASEVSQLISSGFMTSTSALSSSTDTVSRAGAFSLGMTTPVAAAGTTAPTGSHDAVGGVGAVHLRGGGSGGLPTGKDTSRTTGSLTFAIPGTGPYLRLVTEASAHLVQLLAKSSPKHKEALKEMLRERWDGGIPTDAPATRAKRARGEWVGVLPGKTKKWKSFYGMSFDWILEECLGSGAVECFNTGSVGLGVRAA